MKLALINGLDCEIWIRYNKRLDAAKPVLEIEIFLASVDADDLHGAAKIEAGKNRILGSDDRVEFNLNIVAPSGYLINGSPGKFMADDGEVLPAVKLEGLLPAKPTN